MGKCRDGILPPGADATRLVHSLAIERLVELNLEIARHLEVGGEAIAPIGY
jgi:hypothetical protein